MSLTTEMFRAEALAMRGFDVDQIMAAGVKVSLRTVVALVERRRPPITNPEPSLPDVIVARVANWRQRYQAGACERYRMITVIGAAPTLRQIIAETCAAHAADVNHIIGPSRVRCIAHIRHEAMFAAALLTGKSLPAIGRAFGNRDHTTVMHAIRAHALRHGLTLPRGMTPAPVRGKA